ncbi:unnamed protein product, partial [marine sediment metagenome]
SAFYGIIQNNTIFGNSAYCGGGFDECDYNSKILNCIIWGNTAVSDGAQLYDSNEPTYSCIQDWTGSGIGNISVNPKFGDPENGDYHLQPNSPCIDAGRYIDSLSYDFEGDLRGYDSTSEPRGDGSDFDIGTDEYIGAFSTADVIYTFDSSENGWSYVTIDHTLFYPPSSSREKVSVWDWALGIEMKDTTNSGNWQDVGCVGYGSWVSPFDIEYDMSKVYKTRWFITSTQSTEA